MGGTITYTISYENTNSFPVARAHLKHENERDVQNFRRILQLKNEWIDEFESLRIQYDKGKYTLRQMDKLVLKKLYEKKETEILTKAEKLWKQQAPALIAVEAKNLVSSYPNCPPEILRLIHTKAIEMRDKFLQEPTYWSQSFTNYVKNEVDSRVNKGINQEFHTRVNKKVQTELQQKIQLEWPRYINNHITPLCKMHIGNQLKILDITLPILCPRCGLHMDYKLTPFDIADLVSNTKILIKCVDPKCRSLLSRTRISLTLGEIFYHISLSNQTPRTNKYKLAKTNDL